MIDCGQDRCSESSLGSALLVRSGQALEAQRKNP